MSYGGSMPYVPQTVPTDHALILTMTSLTAFYVLMRVLINRMEHYFDKKEKELEEEIEAEEETGDVY